MFPGSPRKRDGVRVIPLGAVSQIALSGDGPDFIVLEVFNTLFSGTTVTLPNDAPVGKQFRFALTTSGVTNPTLSTQYIDIVFPQLKNDGTVFFWRMYSGQRPTFVQGPTGWVTDIGADPQSTASSTGNDLSIGSSANGGNYGTAIGWNTDGNNFGVAVGRRAVGKNSGTAIGGSATAYDYGAAVGYSASGFSNGVAVGYSASGSSSGVAVGYSAIGSSFGVAVGYSAIGSSFGVAVGYSAHTNGIAKAVAIGRYSKAQRYGEFVKSADGVATTLQSWSMVNWFVTTADATPVEALLGGTAAQYCVLLNNSAFQFTAQIIAGVTAGGDTSSWTISGAIKRGANAASTVLVGTPTITMTGQDAGAAAWAVAVTADTVNGSLKLTVTGAAATTIRWNATATLSEIRF